MSGKKGMKKYPAGIREEIIAKIHLGAGQRALSREHEMSRYAIQSRLKDNNVYDRIKKGGDCMSKILGSWSGMRKYLEQEMLADSLRGRVRYGCTTYVGMDGCKIFELCIDGKQIKRFSWESVNSYFIDHGYKSNTQFGGTIAYWKGFFSLLNKYPISDRTEYTDEEFCDALEKYRNQDIQISIYSNNPLVRMFAVLDRRVGKRTLIKLTDELAVQPQWLRQVYELRFSAEEIPYTP